MGHGHGLSDEELEAELEGAMPSPFCEKPWKNMVGVLVASAVVALGISLHSHFAAANEPMVPTPIAGGTPPGVPTGVAPTAAPGDPGGSVVTVGGVVSAEANPARLVKRTERTAFNTAARSVRPSVVGIRAAIGSRPLGRSNLERVGSGVVVHPSGYIVTCEHVVTGTTSIVASRFREDHRRLPAQLVAFQDDLALIKVADAKPFEAAVIADSEQVQVGDWVLAVGHPFGLGLTVTAGIVGRRHGVLDVPGRPRYTGLLQTDAPINEGSSGGPLVDMDGRVVGINTAIYAPTGVFSGAGFAIPSNRVRDFLARHLPSSSGSRTQPPTTPQGAGSWQRRKG